MLYEVPVAESKRIAVAYHGAACAFINRNGSDEIICSASAVFHQDSVRSLHYRVEAERAEHLPVGRLGAQEEAGNAPGCGFAYQGRDHSSHHTLTFGLGSDRELLDRMTCQRAARHKTGLVVRHPRNKVRVLFIPETARLQECPVFRQLPCGQRRPVDSEIHFHTDISSLQGP